TKEAALEAGARLVERLHTGGWRVDAYGWACHWQPQLRSSVLALDFLEDGDGADLFRCEGALPWDYAEFPTISTRTSSDPNEAIGAALHSLRRECLRQMRQFEEIEAGLGVMPAYVG